MTAIQLIEITLEIWGAALSLIVALFLLAIKQNITGKKEIIALALVNALLVISDCMTWIYQGVDTVFAYWIARICNFLVFALSYILLCYVTRLFSLYLVSLKEYAKKWLTAINVLLAVALFLLVGNLFWGYYYTVDIHNAYCRGEFYIVSQLFGLIGLLGNACFLMIAWKKLSRLQKLSYTTYILLPILAILLSIMFKGFNFLNLASTLEVIVLFLGTYMENSQRMLEQEHKISDMQTKIVLSQIQPHFLYNCLNTIYHLCGRDAKKAQNAISDFSDYLRRNLDVMNKNKPVPFSQELQHVQTYLRLEKMRFEKELEIEYNIHVTDFYVPALSLQPIVENAVKHGIGKAPNGGTLMISTYVESCFHVVEVADNGVGFNPVIKKEDDRSHIGISNVKERIATMCNGTLEIQSQPGKGTIAKIYIPM